MDEAGELAMQIKRTLGERLADSETANDFGSIANSVASAKCAAGCGRSVS